MKLNIKYLIPFLLFVSSQIIQSKAQPLEDSPINQTIQASGFINTQKNIQNTLTDEQLNSFSYGAEEFKLAIIGDSGAEKESKEVMKLTSYDALLHLGDYDYECSPHKYFDTILDSKRSYKFMGIIGNHEGNSQCHNTLDEYANLLYKEMTSSKNSGVQCEFSSSKVMWVCIYKNMRIIGLSPDITGTDSKSEQLEFLKKHLDGAKEDWKVCAWHYYDKYYHTGKYPEDSNRNAVSGDGESFYDYCKDHGAIILSAHDHVYARTYVMSKFKSPVIDDYDKDSDGSIVQIRQGATLNILNGVGGYEMYIEQGKEKDYSHWQKKYAKGRNGENAKRYGGLFCQFNYGGNNKKAYCELLRINSSEELFDSFYIYQNENPDTVTYSQIDANFKNEKLNAYMVANNISSNNKEDGNGSENGGTMNNIVEKVFTKTNIIIGGSVCAAAVVLIGGSIFISKRPKKKVIGQPELIGKVSHKDIEDTYRNLNDSFTPLPTPDVLSPLSMYTEKSTFTPLPMPEGLSYFGSRRNSRNEYSFFDKTNFNDETSTMSSSKKSETLGGRSDASSDALSLINHKLVNKDNNNTAATTTTSVSFSRSNSFGNMKFNQVNNNNIRFNSISRPINTSNK
ncbi:hypothetical protein LY90DRAFT_667955 [Neocallimastix californiae]|uniref:Calcineurin-like phosphoesterase domain-containing protein n=1 Tax=Neocallimastix californiae TaxID=1754190 RepID=A0A1Y2E2B4_9FUNG|nr:hypothetical protein LY90DRAFT_667955 [Neocallimastix californiae]|eukprot:ORY65690.1 hypothetical protein LY90DRAFT_667955 [Neocallimastix californiae]